ncbi:unnamed protein product [Owenia fusiformis]|uniref:Phospholipase n=1 Tax=Owenia fusiformis TaxID=6347 RepID=A0A8J1XJS4_OWEFU|nr:unnamed protein product [Owenia fusiformis]
MAETTQIELPEIPEGSMDQNEGEPDDFEVADGEWNAAMSAFDRSVSVFSQGTLWSDDDAYEVLDEFDEDFCDEPDDTIQGEGTRLTRIPFSSIHDGSKDVPFHQRRHFIPGQKIKVQIIDIEKDPNAHRTSLNPFYYVIQLSHGDQQWMVRRKFNHFRSLHDSLTLFKTKVALPVPTRQHRDRRKSFKFNRKSMSRFPKMPDALVKPENMERRKRQLELYLQNMLRTPMYRNHIETLHFLEVSHLSFVQHLGIKRQEGFVLKRTGGRHVNLGCCKCFTCCAKLTFTVSERWSKRWLVVKDTFIAYLHDQNGRIRDVMLMDKDFKVTSGKMDTGTHRGLKVSNHSRQLLLKTGTRQRAAEWVDCIQFAARSTGRDFTTPNRHDSFAPVREDSYAQWFVDGATYFEAAAEAIEMAREEVFITDWWLSPQVYMKRPMTEGDRWRLDELLRRKAEQGVKIFILLYKEMEVALGINSYYTKQILTRKHPNIKVMRHPDGVSLWAHHEKIIVIDQKVAFLGGLDLAYGRWDDPRHKLTDLGSVVLNQPADTNSVTFQADLTTSSEPLSSTRTSTFYTDLPDIDGTDGGPLEAPHSMSENSHNPSACLPERTSNEMSTNNIEHTSNPATIDCKTNDETQHSSDDGKNQTPCGSHKRDDIQNTLSVQADVNLVSEHKQSMNNKLDAIDDNKNITDDNKNKKLMFKEEHTIQEPKGGGDNQNVFDISKIDNTEKIENIDNAMNLLDDTKTNDNDTDGKIRRISKSRRPKQLWLNLSGAISSTFRSRRSLSHDSYNLYNLSESSGAPMLTDISEPSSVQNNSELALNSPTSDTSIKTVQFPLTPGSPEAEPSFSVAMNQQGVKPSTPPASRKKLSGIVLASMIANKFRKGRRKSEEDLSIYPIFIEEALTLKNMGLEGSTKLWIGKDYCNFIAKDFHELDSPFTDFIDRTVTPRMPWHDIGAVVFGKCARDVSRHFIQRWNYTKLKKMRQNKDCPLLLPKSYNKVQVPSKISSTAIMADCQILRSADTWSAGIQHTETSIYQAYIKAIQLAKHYIYIENQFFISVSGHPVVENAIGDAIYERIVKAHEAGDTFRVFVVLPLLPAFEGELGTNKGTAIQAITHWNYQSICRGGNSLIERLQTKVGDPLKYISFCGLRTHDTLNGNLVTELVYVHSKLMIVDDDTTIIGSANINDRSMMGKRDSEIAMIVRDTQLVKVKFAGKDHKAGKFASSLRKTLFREHLGLTVHDKVRMTDPIADVFYKDVWMKYAATNTSVYDRVFRCAPNDYALDYTLLKNYEKEYPPLAKTDPEQAKKELGRVKGHLVLFPLLFLSKVNLLPQIGTKEHMAPTIIWT